MRYSLSGVLLVLSCTFALGQASRYSDTAYQILINKGSMNSPTVLVGPEEVIIIENSFPKGGLTYTDPSGRSFRYAIFWTRVINETANALRITVRFPTDSFTLVQQDTYVKVFLPSHPMSFEKERLFDYGLDLKSFLDSGLHSSTSLRRIIDPGEEYLFYIATLFNRGIDGVVRAGLFLDGKELFYSINGIVIPCGQIVFKKQVISE